MDEQKPVLEHKELAKDARQEQHSDTHITWDEETIARHDLDRGTRMKIDEPDTPYHYYAEGDEVGAVSPARSLSGKEGQSSIEWGELQSKLQDVKDNTKSEWDTEEGGSLPGLNFTARDEEGKKIEKDPQFEEKRKMHYNEFERVRAWKMQHAAEEEDEEEKTAQ